MGKYNLHYAFSFYAHCTRSACYICSGQGQIINLKQKVHHTRYAPLAPSRKWALHAPRTAPPVAALLPLFCLQGSTRRKRL